jgi:hypothetical protein
MNLIRQIKPVNLLMLTVAGIVNAIGITGTGSSAPWAGYFLCAQKVTKNAPRGETRSTSG